MSLSAAEVTWKMSFQLSPIIFNGGIATLIPGGALPIILITESLSFVGGILQGGADIDLDSFFAHFRPLPGSKLASNDYARVPSANQAVASNARIKQPLTLSMLMVCPARSPAGWAGKLATMTALKAAVDLHAGLGGSYTVATPSGFFPGMLLEDIVDTSLGRSAQAQNAYQWNFWQPLLTLQDAFQAQSNLMGQISAGIPVGQAPSWYGLGPTTGNPASLASIATLPAAAQGSGAQAAIPLGGITS